MKEFEREYRRKAEVLRSSDAEDFGPTVRTDSRNGGLAVLERDVLRILNLHACLALDAIGLWHAYSTVPPRELSTIINSLVPFGRGCLGRAEILRNLSYSTLFFEKGV